MKRSAVFSILGVLFLLIACFFGVKLWKLDHAPAAEETAVSAPLPSIEPAAAQSTAEPEDEEIAEDAESDYVSPIDFAALRDANPDIYAWIRIDGTNIDYPVVQRGEDDSFYLTHNSDGEESAVGAIFSEGEYNGTDFSDPVTILYGHNMKSGAIFGYLQDYYSDSDFFGEDNHILVYTPDALLEYEVFAAVPYGDEHILYYNDFTDARVFTAFFAGVLNIRDLRARFNEAYAPEPGDKVLILSTCLSGNLVSQRFLVMATLLA